MASYLASFSKGWSGLAPIGAESFLLGVGLGFCLCLSMFVEISSSFFVFLGLMALFHFAEFLFVAVYHTEEASTDSFLIPHSRAHTIAMTFSFCEFWLEVNLFNEFMFYDVRHCACYIRVML